MLFFYSKLRPYTYTLKNVPLCEVPVLTATLLRSRRAVLTLFSVLVAVRCTTL